MGSGLQFWPMYWITCLAWAATLAYALPGVTVALAESNTSIEQQVARIRRSIADKDYAAARSRCDWLLEQHPLAPELRALRLFVAWQEKADDSLLAELDEIIRLYPSCAEAYLVRGEMRGARRMLDLAIRDASRCLDLAPAHPRAYAVRGQLYEQTSQWGQAYEDFSQHMQRFPDDMAILARRGIVAYKLGQTQRAKDDLTRALAAGVRDATAYVTRGRIFEAEKDYARAEEDYSQALKLDAQHADARVRRGVLYYLQKRYEDAIADLSQALVLRSQDIEALEYRGLSRLMLGDADAAASDFQILVRFRSFMPRYQVLYARALLELGRTDEAMSRLTDVIGKHPSSWDALDALYYRGMLHVQLDQHQAAIKDFTDALERVQDFAPLYIARAAAYRNAGQMDLAQKDLDTARQKDAKLPSVYAEQAYLYRVLGKNPEALRALEQALALDNQHFTSLVHRGGLLAEMGKFSAAAQDFDKAAHVVPKSAKHPARAYCQALASVYRGDVDGALAFLEKELAPRAKDKNWLYDAACVYALTADYLARTSPQDPRVASCTDKAFQLLAQCLHQGYRHWSHMDQDPDLKRLRADRRYQDLKKSVPSGKKK